MVPATDPVAAVLARIPLDGPVPPLPDPAERVRLRETFGWTVTQMGKANGVRRETVWTWESDPPRTPRGERGQLYARILAYFADELARAAVTTGAAAPVPDAGPVPQCGGRRGGGADPCPVRLRHRGTARTRLGGRRPESGPRPGGGGRVPRVRRARLLDRTARGRHPALCPLRAADPLPRRRRAPARLPPGHGRHGHAPLRHPARRPGPARPRPAHRDRDSRRPCPLRPYRLPPLRRSPHRRSPHRHEYSRPLLPLLPRLPFARRPHRTARAPPPVRPPAARR